MRKPAFPRGFSLLRAMCLCAVTGCAPGQTNSPVAIPRNAIDPDLIRVIVQLRVPSTAVDDATRAELTSKIRDALLREIRSTPHRVLRTYETIPFVALALSPEAMRIVERSQWVLSVQRDELSTPQ